MLHAARFGSPEPRPNPNLQAGLLHLRVSTASKAIQGYLAQQKQPPPPWGHHRSLGIGLLYGPRRLQFPTSEVPLYPVVSIGSCWTPSSWEALLNPPKLIPSGCPPPQVVNGEMTVGQWVMIQTYLLQLAQPLAWLGTAWRVIQQVPTHFVARSSSWSVCFLLLRHLLGQLSHVLTWSVVSSFSCQVSQSVSRLVSESASQLVGW